MLGEFSQKIDFSMQFFLFFLTNNVIFLCIKLIYRILIGQMI